MLQGQIPWGYQHIWNESGVTPHLYLLFLLVAVVVGIVKLLIVWRVAPPFRLSRVKGSPSYLDKLAATSASLQRWMGAAFFSWAILVSFNVIRVGQRILEQQEPWGVSILIVIMFYAEALSGALLVALLLYLIRWHILKRIEYLGKQGV
jgi:hypothetical protein